MRLKILVFLLLFPILAKGDSLPEIKIPDYGTPAQRIQEYAIFFTRQDNGIKIINGCFRQKEKINRIRSILKLQGVPEELVCLAMVESNLYLDVWNVDGSGARGLWQFTKPTAKRFDLKVNGNVDERCDLEKSTIAAAEYIKELYAHFNNWDSAIAAFNIGEKRLNQIMGNNGNRKNYWELKKGPQNHSRLLPKQNYEFVPQVLAVIKIANKQGLFIGTGTNMDTKMPSPKIDLSEYYFVGIHDSWEIIAGEVEMSVEEVKSQIKAQYKTANLYPGMKIKKGKKTHSTAMLAGHYTVKKEDDWDKVAQKTNMSIAQLKNYVSFKYRLSELQPEMKIKIEAQASLP